MNSPMKAASAERISVPLIPELHPSRPTFETLVEQVRTRDFSLEARAARYRALLAECNRLIPAWSVCGDCDGFRCAIHDMHTHECPCPDLEIWYGQDLDPYAPCIDPDTKASPLEFNQ